MATTSTNKQPMMMDRVFHRIVDLTASTIGSNQQVDIGGTNSAALVLDCTQNDGAIIAELYSLGRATNIGEDGDTSKDQPPYIVCVYMSPANDYLRDSQAKYVTAWQTGGTFGGFETRTLEGEKVTAANLPYILAPVPGVGSEDDSEVIGTQFQGLYVPKGFALWAAIQAQGESDQAINAPLICAQGGFF